MRTLTITGAGVVSPLGVGWRDWQEALADLETASSRARKQTEVHNGDTHVKVEAAAIIEDFEPKSYLGEKGLRNFDRLTTFFIVAAKHALETAGIKKDGTFIQFDSDRVGVCLSTAYGSLDAITELNRVAELEEPRFINPSRFPNTVINSAAGYVSIWEGLTGPNTTVVDGNCGALNTVMQCETHMRSGRGDMFLVGGGEVFSAPFYLALEKLGVVGKKGDLLLGEGAAMLCVESVCHARTRNARSLAEIDGYGTAFEPPSSEAILVHASPLAVERAARNAIRDAGLEAEHIDAVCSAASGLPMIDDAEQEGLSKVFKHKVPTHAPKFVIGETHGAAGAFGMLTAVSWLRGSPSSPVPGLEDKKDATVLVTAVGYYGNVSAVVMRAPMAT